nr:MAG TPA: hypothetical protein [Bacteriophage sp.]
MPQTLHYPPYISNKKSALPCWRRIERKPLHIGCNGAVKRNIIVPYSLVFCKFIE